MSLWLLYKRLSAKAWQVLFAPGIRRSFGACGKNVKFAKSCSISGIRNLYVGNNVSLANVTVLSTRARVIIGTM